MAIDAFRAAIDALEPLVQSWTSLVENDPGASLLAFKNKKKMVVDCQTSLISAHTTLALHALLPRLQLAALSLDTAYTTFSWARHASQQLLWTINTAGGYSLVVGNTAHLFHGTLEGLSIAPHQHVGLRTIEASVLAIHRRLNGIAVAPTDPVWKVGPRHVGAPNGGTAQILKAVFEDHTTELPPGRLDKVVLAMKAPALRAEMAAALQKVHA
jgi:hypothetical protein